jgi:hypothetical protein
MEMEMRGYSFLMGAAALALADFKLPPMIILPEPAPKGKAPLKIMTGRYYPHSSKRQRDRYARQLAAGQIKFA